MRKKPFRVGKHLFTITRAIDEGQHWHGELYPWVLGTYSKIERWIGDTSLNKWIKFIKLPI
jgi:hypothetical protein